VDGDAVPIPHFGAVMDMESFRNLARKLESSQEVIWILRPKTRFEGEPGEQATMFIKDPSGNAIEFKGADRIRRPPEMVDGGMVSEKTMTPIRPANTNWKYVKG